MSEEILFSQEDCLQSGYDFPIIGKVIVLKPSVLPEEFRDTKHQLYLCTGGFGSNPNPSGRSVFTVSLSDGEQVRWNRSDILGIAKPEILSDHSRLQLSQIRPSGALNLKSNELQYSGYCLTTNKPPAMPGETASFSFKKNTSYDRMATAKM